MNTGKTTAPHLIFSHAYDYSTDQVIDWLLHYGQSVQRINNDKRLMENADLELSTLDGKEKETRAAYASVWFRKVAEVFRSNTLQREDLAEPKHYSQLPYFNESIDKDLRNVHDHYHQQFKAKKRLSRYFLLPINKLEVLEQARRQGLDIPHTLVTKQRRSLQAFWERQPHGLINKSISDHLTFVEHQENPRSYSNYTEELTEEDIQQLPETFGLSLFQEKLDKQYEIRTFYLDGKCYSMAIFSQRSAQTQLDFRRYDKARPNRRTAYQLDKAVEQKIVKLMQALDLNTGSLDLVKTKDGRLVFLEVNPSGQFGMTSYPCNYYLNKLIAEYLIDHETE